MNEYKYQIVMPAKGEYWDEYEGTFKFNHHKSPETYPAKMLRETFHNYYTRGWDTRPEFFQTYGRIEDILKMFNYKLITSREIVLEKDFLVFTLTLRTNAVGSHLIDIMTIIADNVRGQTQGHGFFVGNAKIRHKGWVDLDTSKLVECEHENNTRLSVMNDEKGVIVAVCECHDCNQLFKIPVRF